MAQKVAQPMDGSYTTSADSTVNDAAATVAALGLSNFYVDYVTKGLDAYFGKLSPFINIVRDGVWLDQTNSVEDGASSATWDAGEFDSPKHGQVTEGFDQTVTPVRITSGTVLSTTELTRAAKISDKRFEILLAEKQTKPGRDLVNAIIAKYLAEVVNKVDVATTSYKAPDGQAAISGSHVNAHGVFAYDNEVDVVNADADVRMDTFLEGVRTYAATTKDSSGLPMDVSFDTYFVAQGSEQEEALKRKLGQTMPITSVGAEDIQRMFSTESNLYPATTSQIEVFTAGSSVIVSTKGQAADLVFAVDRSKESIYELKITKDITMLTHVPMTSGAVEIPFESFLNFWQPKVARHIVGGRLTTS